VLLPLPRARHPCRALAAGFMTEKDKNDVILMVDGQKKRVVCVYDILGGELIAQVCDVEPPPNIVISRQMTASMAAKLIKRKDLFQTAPVFKRFKKDYRKNQFGASPRKQNPKRALSMLLDAAKDLDTPQVTAKPTPKTPRQKRKYVQSQDKVTTDSTSEESSESASSSYTDEKPKKKPKPAQAKTTPKPAQPKTTPKTQPKTTQVKLPDSVPNEKVAFNELTTPYNNKRPIFGRRVLTGVMLVAKMSARQIWLLYHVGMIHKYPGKPPSTQTAIDERITNVVATAEAKWKEMLGVHKEELDRLLEQTSSDEL